MNMNQRPTEGQLPELLGAKIDDDGWHTLWVDKAGSVDLDVVDDDGVRLEGARLRYAPFQAGVQTDGADAASNPELVGELFVSLVGQWAAALTAPRTRAWSILRIRSRAPTGR